MEDRWTEGENEMKIKKPDSEEGGMYGKILPVSQFLLTLRHEDMLEDMRL
jgi:hypothetical protein